MLKKMINNKTFKKTKDLYNKIWKKKDNLLVQILWNVWVWFLIVIGFYKPTWQLFTYTYTDVLYIIMFSAIMWIVFFFLKNSIVNLIRSLISKT